MGTPQNGVLNQAPPVEPTRGGFRYPFELVFSFFLDIYLGVELLDHMVVLFLVFKGTSMLFSIVTTPPTSGRGFRFLHILSSNSYW